MILFDTNILIYAHNKLDSRYSTCRNWLKKIELKEIKGFLSSQNITEFLSAILKTGRINKKKINLLHNTLQVKSLEKIFNFIFPNSQTLNIFNDLIVANTINTKQIYDTFLVATMLSNGVNQILTYNAKDFADFKEIKIISP